MSRRPGSRRWLASGARNAALGWLARVALACAALAWTVGSSPSDGRAEAPRDAPAGAESALLGHHPSPLGLALAEGAASFRAGEENRGPQGRIAPRLVSGRAPARALVSPRQRARSAAFRAARAHHLDFASRLALTHAGLPARHATAPPRRLV